MDEQNKHRLIGAIVLVAIALFVLPLVFKKPGPKVSLAPIPSAEEVKSKGLAISPSHSSAAGNAATLGGKEKAILPAPPALEKKKPAKKSSSLPSKTIAQAIKAPLKQKKGWVVQIGSFSNKLNAQRLLARLHSRGFHANLRSIANTKKTTMQYKIIVGPPAQRTVAKHRLEKLHRSLQLKGFVIKL